MVRKMWSSLSRCTSLSSRLGEPVAILKLEVRQKPRQRLPTRSCKPAASPARIAASSPHCIRWAIFPAKSVFVPGAPACLDFADSAKMNCSPVRFSAEPVVSRFREECFSQSVLAETIPDPARAGSSKTVSLPATGTGRRRKQELLELAPSTIDRNFEPFPRSPCPKNTST
jgi:hypothetical protein